MRIDRYTQFLLTVIALCLVYLCVRDLMRPLKAQADSPVRVMLVDEANHPIASSMSGFPLSGGGYPLAVKVETSSGK